MLGSVAAYRERMHLGLDILVNRLQKVGRRRAQIIADLMVLIFAFLVLCIGGAKLVNLTWTLEQVSPALNIPMAYVYSVLPLSGVLMMFYCCVAIFESSTAVSAEDSVEGEQ